MIEAANLRRRSRWQPLTALAVVALAVAGWIGPSAASAAGRPASATGRSANDAAAASALLGAFRRHRVVALGQGHVLRQQDDFILRLLERPRRFAAAVDAIVVEFGNARYQSLVDRYVAGEDVPAAALRPVWRDLVATGPGMLDYPAPFFAAVRRLNRALPAGRRVRVALGDPAFDWSRLQRPEDVEPAGRDRDRVFAAAALRAARHGRRVLLLSGFMHLVRVPPLVFGGNALRIIERRLHHRVWTVVPYTGGSRHPAAFERRFVSRWAPPAIRRLAGALGRRPADRILPALPPNAPRRVARIYRRLRLAGIADALISFGPCAQLRPTVVSRALYRDPAYRAEMDRRSQILFGEPFVPPPADPPNQPYCPLRNQVIE
jgi:hypothetical protein